MKPKDRYTTQIIVLCLCLLLLSGVAYLFSPKLHILFYNSDFSKDLKGTIRCTFIATIQNSHHLRMQLLVPYKDRKHWIEIKEALPKVKNDFILAINQEGMEDIVRRRDFEVIRSLLLKTFNQNLTRPVDNVYFENFFYD